MKSVYTALVLYRERQFLETLLSELFTTARSLYNVAKLVTLVKGEVRVFEQQDEEQATVGTNGAGISGLSVATSAPPAATSPRRSGVLVYEYSRSTVRDTWGWLWKDTAGRVTPFFAASMAYAWWRTRQGENPLFPKGSWLPDALAGVALGIPLAGIAAVYREWTGPGYRLPTPADQVVQSAYYFLVNAPAEELFWRATVQDITVRALEHVPGVRRHNALVGWALVTTAFGLYHRLGNWNWRSIAGVTAVGALFGALYQWRRSVIMPTIMHGFATAGFLSWADVYIHKRTIQRYIRRAQGR